MRAGPSVRPFDRDRDTVELVGMWRASFEQGVGVTDPHPVDEQTAFLLDQVVPSHQVVVAQDESGIVGFLAATDESIGHLYVRVDRFGEGIGSALLGRAKRESSGRLWLYTFARNHRALAFYSRHGFVEVARGFEPTWQLDDVRMEWSRPIAQAAHAQRQRVRRGHPHPAALPHRPDPPHPPGGARDGRTGFAITPRAGRR